MSGISEAYFTLWLPTNLTQTLLILLVGNQIDAQCLL